MKKYEAPREDGITLQALARCDAPEFFVLGWVESAVRPGWAPSGRMVDEVRYILNLYAIDRARRHEAQEKAVTP